MGGLVNVEGCWTNGKSTALFGLHSAMTSLGYYVASRLSIYISKFPTY